MRIDSIQDLCGLVFTTEARRTHRKNRGFSLFPLGAPRGPVVNRGRGGVEGVLRDAEAADGRL
jgi:hypothetical protein